jgi:Ca-activated chloride channel homolog
MADISSPVIPAALGLAEVASLEFTYVALPALEQHTATMPLHVNVVPGDEAARRIPNPTVRTEFAFQQAQRAKREASSALSAGDTATAGRRCELVAGSSRMPAPWRRRRRPEPREEVAVLKRLEQQTRDGGVAHAAKLSSMDSAHKSRTHGRHHGRDGH